MAKSNKRKKIKDASTKGSRTCEECSKSFPSAAHLARHMAIQTGKLCNIGDPSGHFLFCFFYCICIIQ